MGRGRWLICVECLLLGCLNKVVVLPLADSDRSGLPKVAMESDRLAVAMPLAVVPLPFIFFAVRIFVVAKPMAFAVAVLPDVMLPMMPVHLTQAMFLPLGKVSCVKEPPLLVGPGVPIYPEPFATVVAFLTVLVHLHATTLLTQSTEGKKAPAVRRRAKHGP